MSDISYSMFQDVLFPPTDTGTAAGKSLTLARIVRYSPQLTSNINEIPIIVFDFETTGLDTKNDYLIEIGALKTVGGKIVEEYSTLISPPIEINDTIISITGITRDMLQGQPTIQEKLPEFLEFIEGGILAAHNADFDYPFLKNVCEREGIQLDWPTFCTLKMARHMLPELESKSLDALAEYFDLTFESRHRSIGDCKVTSAVLQSMLRMEESTSRQWQSLENYMSK